MEGFGFAICWFWPSADAFERHPGALCPSCGVLGAASEEQGAAGALQVRLGAVKVAVISLRDLADNK